MMRITRNMGHQVFRSSQLRMLRRSVWHAGYENAKESKEIEGRLKELLAVKETDKSASQSTGRAKEIQSLREEYEIITGEPYENP